MKRYMIVQQNIKSTDIKLPALSLSKDLETIITCPLGGITTIVCYLYSNVAPLVTSTARFVAGIHQFSQRLDSG